MRAVRSHDHRVDVVDLPDPTAPADGVVVLIAAAGICGSDLHMVERFDLPVTLGHEFSGFLPDGRLVAVEPLGACRTCAACLDGRPYHCERGGLKMFGTAFDGGMAERCVVPAETIVPIPAGVDPRDSSLVEPLAVTVHAVRMAGSLAGSSCVVLGGGTVGLCTVPSLQAVGVDPVDLVARHGHQIEAAQRLGATVVEPARSRWDVVFDAVGTEESLAQSFDMVKPGGRVVVIGIYWDGGVSMPGFLFGMKEIRLIASMVYGSDAHGRDFDHAARILAARPELGPTLITHRFPLDAAVEAFAVARDRASGSIKVILEP